MYRGNEATEHAV